MTTPGAGIKPEYVAEQVWLAHKIARFGTLVALQLVPVFALVE
jgi:hypothetical protein